MAVRLQDFIDRKISLSTLIADLEGLIESLENIDPESRNEFRKYWGVLEDIYADALYHNISGVPAYAEGQISEAINTLSKMIIDWNNRDIATDEGLRSGMR
jgi:hypothetical protein